MDIYVWLIGPIIQIIIGIAGFFFATQNIKKQHELDLIKYRKDISLNKMEEIPEKITEIIQNLYTYRGIPPEGRLSYINKLEPIAIKIIAYGSLKANKIYSHIRKCQCEKDEDYFYKNLSCFILLYCQIRYDLSGEEFNPKLAGDVNFREVGFNTDTYKKTSNKIVDELKLDKYFKIK
ncbi:MAG: hypothetical protein FD141_372 [Fusobacteria bacterium]|nr:MAG: hypothetical protein FD141_372 [Fusobacteriota bacterium]KAF0228963.1 MAG: hypothetical protein FD182_1219 [Fusobacteriota bacterium]